MQFLKMPWANALFYCLLSFGLVLSSCHQEEELEQPAPIAQPDPQPEPQNPDECITKASVDNGNAIPGEYIVKYTSENEGMQINSNNIPVGILSKLNISESNARHIFSGKFRAFSARLTAAQVENLRQDPSVEAIEPDRIVSIVSCYTQISDQTIPWGVQRVGYGDGTGKTVWIIDTGVDLEHPDLNIDARRSKSFIKETSVEDDHGHGTHVAGTIAAKNNYAGVVGVAANASIVALKVMNQSGKGSMSHVIAAVNHVSQYAKPGDVVNMSIGGELSDILDKAIIDAAKKGIYFAVAAGNAAIDATQSSPARVDHPNVFTISAMNDQDTWASFSNYGTPCDFCAPGVNIASTHKDGGYASMSGTSMATPHVAGLLLLKGKNILIDGFVKEDPDEKPDPIPHK